MDTNEVEAFLAYRVRLEDEGLWWHEGLIDTVDHGEYFMQRFVIQREIEAQYAPLPMFFLEKTETFLLAEQLREDLREEFEGSHALDARSMWRKVWQRPNHDRDNPSFVLPLVLSGCIRREDEAELLAMTWRATEFPEQNGGRELWVEAFREVGWLCDGDDDEAPPTKPFTVFRGAQEAYARGMAWTDKEETAQWFAKRNGNGRVWIMLATPKMVLAHFHDRGENEWVLDVPPDAAILPTGRSEDWTGEAGTHS